MARLIEKITPFRVMDILAKARTMPDAVHMEVGEPDLPPSEKVLEAYLKAVQERKFHYTPSSGLPELREKIAEYYQKKYSVSISPGRILITPGTSGAFLVILSMLIDKERKLVLPDPSYPCYKNFSYFLDTEPLLINIDRSTSYEVRPEALTGLNSFGALMVSSPSNPIGNIYSAETIKGLTSLAEEKGFWYISDEIYHGLVYANTEETAIQYSERAIVVSGFSKYFCMPGFRVGWMILPEDLVRRAEIIIQNIFIAANTPAQYAALEAFDDSYLKGIRARFQKRRDYLYQALKDIFEIEAEPEGAFYIWANISRYSVDAVQFCSELLEKKAVAVTPGIDFGKNGTDHFIRFAYTREIAELEEGVKRIKEFLSETTGK